MCGELKVITTYIYENCYVQHFALFICQPSLAVPGKVIHFPVVHYYLFGKAPQRIWLKLNRVLYYTSSKVSPIFPSQDYFLKAITEKNTPIVGQLACLDLVTLSFVQ